ncbi:uncharacterized protein LOC132271534 isoform X1 [Cornus florida]|uniref:uncharacterized protein LOC132271534 isoform X1 n=1 Tax=Cornus florida TaxID=4283 RepID=UPI00289CF5A6|nr:uncharacterized protein LOC132271534 isoform X1 [Cornus florida]XP_059628918.1 uncharacterized protein LOC132271534 isoform X1 [Cornus florida]XP_059628919.1 uncharacterized protein LOC132271534 isoform X1 [Cornus florida]
MMGLGSLGNGGSTSSSSNLSALAPPFTVDRSNPKPMSNPLVNFTEPPYAVPFNSSSQYWSNSYSSASRPDFFSNVNPEVDSIRTTCVASVTSFGFSGSQSINSPSANWSPLNPSAKDAIDVSYLRYSGDIPTSLVESKPFYPPYVSPVVDHDTPLLALNEPSFDLLPMSHVVPSDVPSQVDYTRSLSGLEYTPHWGGIWNGLANEEHGKRVELERNFCSEEMNIAGSYVYSNYMEQGAHIAESLSKCEDDSAILHSKYVDILERENHSVPLSTEQLDDKSFLAQNPMFNAAGSSRTSILGATSVFPESHPQVPSLESASKSWNFQKPHVPSHEKCFQLLDSCMNDCILVTKSSPALVIRPPATGTISVPSRILSDNVNFIGNIAAVNTEEFDDHNTSKRKEAHLSLSSEGKERCLDTSQVSFYLGGNDSFFAASSTKKEELPNRLVGKDVLDHTFKPRSEFQVPDINAPDGFVLAVDSAKNVGSVENSSESLDHHNPAVDSPCWKGAPSSYFSPFEESKAVTPQHVMRTLETSSNLNLQGTQVLSPYADDCVKVSSQKLCESSALHEIGCKKNHSSLLANRSSNFYSAAQEHRSDDAVKVGLDCPKLSSSCRVQFSNDIDKPRKEYDLLNYSSCDSDFNPSQTKQQELEERVKVWAGVADTRMNTNNALEYGCVPLHATMDNVSCLPSGEDASRLAKLHEGESAPKMNVQMLVKAMHNLSELLLCHCSNDTSALNEQDHEALKHAINNLDACLSKKNRRMTPTRESFSPQQSISQKLGVLPDLHKASSASKPKVTGEAAANSHGQIKFQRMHKEKRNHNAAGKKVNRFPDFLSLRDDADIVRDDSMVQAIKKVLNENFCGEEEMQTQTLLYKNLWLEAEAALCAINYRARFDRTKIEMEKCNSLKAKGVLEDTGPIEKSSHPNIADKLTTEARDCQIPDISFLESPNSSTTSHVDDVETSVMATFQILKGHSESSSSGIMEEKQLPKEVDAGCTDDVEASVMARFQILKCRGENSSSGIMEEKQLPMEVDAGFTDDVEGSAMARFQILKCRGENSSSGIMEEEQLPKEVDTGFTVNITRWPFIGVESEGGRSDVGLGPQLKHHTGDVSETFGPFVGSSDHETVKAVTDDLVIQSCRNSKQWNQLPSVWNDTASSDWEHVLKDEFAWKN